MDGTISQRRLWVISKNSGKTTVFAVLLIMAWQPCVQSVSTVNRGTARIRRPTRGRKTDCEAMDGTISQQQLWVISKNSGKTAVFVVLLLVAALHTLSQHCEPGDCENKETHEGTKNRLRSNGWDHFSTATLSYDMQFLIWWHHSLGPLKESVGISQAYKPEQKNRHQSWYTFKVPGHGKQTMEFMGSFHLHSSTSFTFWSSQFICSSKSNWTGIWTSNSNGTWTDKQSSHFSTAKEIRVKATFFFI